ncbi:MAG: tRNA uridine-5-carboxymethylaminomethyl(34) synthesis GTPase MnmE [Paracoccaceae bacterium]|nr:tRNA uridine-5-carboxymethylaminomethyl(34) synthesis GTPase MnmE [Paracoccaceae bacterium]
MDTIFALATPEGKSGVAIIRVSGKNAFQLFEKFSCPPVNPNEMGLRTLIVNKKLLDEALILCFGEGRSFTGEKVVEIHHHGSLAIIQRCLSILGGISDFRMANPGEFTKRAFEHGRLDLSQVEGLSALIDAETTAQLDQAQRVFKGALGKVVGGWRKDLISSKALIESAIDFSDEDIPQDLLKLIRIKISVIKSDLRKEIDGTIISERISSGFEVAIIGAPNVGKSTLFNALLKRKAAITSNIAGTTRDVIEARLDIGGIPLTILDTAGIRNAKGSIEKTGVKLALARAKNADLRIFVSDNNIFDSFGLKVRDGDLKINNKSDLKKNKDVDISISAKFGDGIDELLEIMVKIFKEKVGKASIAINERHRNSMVRALNALDAAERELNSGMKNIELCAEEINIAIRAMDSLVGSIDVEEVLGEIYSKFCIGK